MLCFCRSASKERPRDSTTEENEYLETELNNILRGQNINNNNNNQPGFEKTNGSGENSDEDVDVDIDDDDGHEDDDDEDEKESRLATNKSVGVRRIYDASIRTSSAFLQLPTIRC